MKYALNPPPGPSLPYRHPEERCRAFEVPEVDAVIREIKCEVADPKLFRLFENTFPNTLDTTVLWKWFSEENLEEGVSAIANSATGNDPRLTPYS